jgi:hypothetical protein
MLPVCSDITDIRPGRQRFLRPSFHRKNARRRPFPGKPPWADFALPNCQRTAPVLPSRAHAEPLLLNTCIDKMFRYKTQILEDL